MDVLQQYYFINLHTIIFENLSNPLNRIRSFQRCHMLPQKDLTDQAKEYIREKNIYQLLSWLYDDRIPINMWCIDCKNCQYCICCYNCTDCIGISFSIRSRSCFYSMQLKDCESCMYCENYSDEVGVKIRNSSYETMLVTNPNLIRKWRQAYRRACNDTCKPQFKPFNNKYSDECSICFDDNKLNLVCLSCDHVLCKQCAEKVLTLNSKCPICRKEIRRNSLNSALNMDVLCSRLGSMRLSL